MRLRQRRFRPRTARFRPRLSTPSLLRGPTRLAFDRVRTSMGQARRGLAGLASRPVGLRVKLAIGVGLAFVGMVLIPSAIAVLTHRGQTEPVLSWVSSKDARVPIKVLEWNRGKVVTMPLNDYVLDVVAAEMNPSAPIAALEAAAVAARTYAIRSMLPIPPGVQPTFAQSHGANVTDNATLDLPWLTTAQQEDKFGKADAVLTLRLEQAVQATDGQVLTYHGSPIVAFMTALSPGETRDGKSVFGQPVPYLKSVKCPDDLKDPKETQTFRFSTAQLQQLLGIPAAPAGSAVGTPAASATGASATASGTHTASKSQAAGSRGSSRAGAPASASASASASKGAAVRGLIPADLKMHGADAQGFVQSVTYGKQTFSGMDFANRLHLPSSSFTWKWQGQTLVVTTKGIGNGLGMSLHEATVMAGRKMSYSKILATFYPGTQLVSDAAWTQGLASSSANASGNFTGNQPTSSSAKQPANPSANTALSSSGQTSFATQAAGTTAATSTPAQSKKSS
ncbi:SpoIID/LytB domain-containing protein [Alicyclobacillus tolerans]|uniref:SpoIID/LytB domain-containing protein n=1 Tax=Alicyclobacillus tolerans TaxID=90970 RepID=UPI001F015CA5|nr:SpoIID/LytB domain-containing protein [Alicyclobacillus tolerans]MCF8567181.1 SpoIID/LytB domain-containing protein [Alicyclobacillus tolerans]